MQQKWLLFVCVFGVFILELGHALSGWQSYSDRGLSVNRRVGELIAEPHLSVRPDGSDHSTFTLHFARNALTTRYARVTPQGCVTDIAFNGVPLNSLTPIFGHLCDNSNGFSFTVAPGSLLALNTLEIGVRSLGTVVGIRLENDNWKSYKFLIPLVGLLLLLAAGVRFAIDWADTSLKLGPLRPWPIFSVIVLGTVARYLVCFYLDRFEFNSFSDLWIYSDYSRSWLRGVFKPEHGLKPLGYTILFFLTRAGYTDVFQPMHWIHFATSAMVPLVSWLTLRRLFSPRIALFSLILLELHPHLIGLVSVAFPDCIFTLSLVLLAHSCTSSAFSLGHGLVIGLWYSLGNWTRGNNILWLPIYGIWLLYHRQIGNLRRHWSGVLMVSIISWTGYGLVSLTLFRRFDPMPGNSGLSFVEAHCPEKWNYDSSGMNFLSPLFTQTGEVAPKHWPRPFSDTRYFLEQGLQCLASSPVRIIEALRYIFYLFYGNRAWPLSEFRLHAWYDPAQIGVGFLIPPGLMIAAFWILYRKHHKKVSLLTFPAALFLCSWLTKSEARYRIPYDPILIPLALYGWDRLRRSLFPSARVIDFTVGLWRRDQARRSVGVIKKHH